MSNINPNHVHALDAHMMNNAIECIDLDFDYELYVNWLDSFTCVKVPGMKINRLDEATYNLFKTLRQEEK